MSGFLISGDDSSTLYVSGDNTSLAVIREIAQRVGHVDIAILFAGGAQLPYVGEGHLTLTSAAAAKATQMLNPQHVVPAHIEGWAHLTENVDDLRTAFAAHGFADGCESSPRARRSPSEYEGASRNQAATSHSSD